MPGMYSFPFKIKIPKECPSSLIFYRIPLSKAIIKYTIKGILESSKYGKGPMKFKTRFIVR